MVALVDEQRNADLSTGLDSSGLQGVGGGVALDTRLGLGDFQLDEVGDFDAEDLALIAQQLARLVLLAELEVIGHIGSVDGDIVIGLVVHEVVQIAILIAVSHVLALDESLRELCGRVVAGLNHRAGDHVLGLGADKGSALAGLHVLELNDLKNLAVLLKGHAVAKLACRNHRNSSISKISLMLNAYLYLFYSIPHGLARGLSKKDDKIRKKLGERIKPLRHPFGMPPPLVGEALAAG